MELSFTSQTASEVPEHHQGRGRAREVHHLEFWRVLVALPNAEPRRLTPPTCSSHELTELPGGGLRVKVRLNSLEEVERWVLSFGRHSTVLGPPELIIRSCASATDITVKYAPKAVES